MSVWVGRGLSLDIFGYLWIVETPLQGWLVIRTKGGLDGIGQVRFRK